MISRFLPGIFLTAFLMLTNLASAQILSKTFRLDQAEPKLGLASNTVTDIVIHDFTIWFGTGRGLSKTVDNGALFESYTREHGIGRGGVSGLAVNDSVVWVATGFDSLTSVGLVSAGGGLAFSRDQGATWTFIEQPGPTPAQNISYDIALRANPEAASGYEVWITSFGGGLRKSSDQGASWQIVTPDSLIFNPNGNLNHRAFAVTVADGVLWVGTAGGINRSTDGGETWVSFPHDSSRQNETISGNFVVAIKRQQFGGEDIIWASTRETTVESGDPTEFRGISWSRDQGYTWQTGLRGETIHNIAFDDSVVYAAADKGLFKSNDFGQSWFLFPTISNPSRTRMVLSNEVFSVGVTEDHTLWAGTRNGLARSSDNGASWEVFQVFAQTSVNGEPRTYAYPNPFSPNVHNQLNGDGYVRFQYNTVNDTRVTIKIYDFAMEHVATVVEGLSRPANGDFYEIWNGKNGRGEQVHNGVYFYRLELQGDGTFWGKLIVLN